MQFVKLFCFLTVYFFVLQVSDANSSPRSTFNCIPQTDLRRYQYLHDRNRPPVDSTYRGHPLDPLSGFEIQRAKEIINNCLPPSPSDEWIFNTITLKEPPKLLIAPYFYKNEEIPRGIVPRQAFCIIRKKSEKDFIEVVLNLSGRGLSIVNVKILGKDDQPFFTDEDADLATDILWKDPEFVRRCSELGYSTPETVFDTDWSMGYVGDNPKYMGKRLVQAIVYGIKLTNGYTDNVYAHPFPFVCVVDLVEKKVLDILDTPCRDDLSTNNTGVTVPSESADYDAALLPPTFYRKDIKPIQITFPNGPSYTAVGNQIKWQKYSFRLGFNAREGLVIYLVSYNDGKIRPLIYRAAISEMWIPYGDPRLPTGPMKNVFDQGQFGVGYETQSLNSNQEFFGGNIHFIDAVMNNEAGEPWGVKRAICIEEQDAGILWRHTDEVSGRTSFARSRRLAISFLIRSGNYEYFYHWYFHQDASIELQVQLTGVLETNLLAKGSPFPPYGNPMSEQVFAQFHQHFFCARIDTDIDGPLNSVSTVDIIPDPHPLDSILNDYGNGIIAKVTRLNTTGEGVTDTSPSTSRVWKISNDNYLNPITHLPVSYVLKPANSPGPIWSAESPSIGGGRFSTHSMWVTLYNDSQMFAGGDYLNNYGVPEWVKANPDASIVNKDVVLWHSFGITHNTRIEDWPVMPAETTGFLIKPVYFFKKNTGLDVPNSNGNKYRDSSANTEPTLNLNNFEI